METLYISENQKRKASENRNNQSGIVLILSLVFLCILALLGSTAVVLTTTDMKIGSNYRDNAQAFSSAQAGVAEAIARLNGSSTASGYAGDTGATPHSWWSAYILTTGTWSTADDPEYNANYQNYFPSGTNYTSTTASVNTLQSTVDVDYFVKIKHKREYDAEQAGHTTTTTHYADGDGNLGTNPLSAPGSIVYYGDDPTTVNDKSWVYFTSAGTPTPREARPVEIIRSYGESNGSLAVVEVEIKKIALNIATEAAIYAKDIITANGAVDVDGTDQAGTVGAVDCGGVSEPAKPPFYNSPTGTSITLNGVSSELDGALPTACSDAGLTFNDLKSGTSDCLSGDVDIPITDYVTQMGLPGAATEIILADQNNGTYGADGNGNSIIAYCDATVLVGGLKLNGVTGYGLLAVKGDLVLGGGFTWYGLVLCTGTLTFNGGGGPNAINITGAVLANQTVTMNGSVNVQYDSCYIQEALTGMSAQVARWRQVY
ncbi:MAG: pilus assembly PilX N-terminal domain-containing protein [Deltaproteobacteria bacterium]|nr:pilus assembly PilX N-terminal domain-containing protein [Deltaproteobacteria bacterium]